MRTTCSIILVVWSAAGTAPAQETAPSTRDLEAVKRLLDLPEASTDDYARVKGTWELVQDTGEPVSGRRVKTHQEGKTTVTTYDVDGKVVGQHRSQYKLKTSGMSRIFVYFKIVPSTGPSKGREFPGPFYYVYNVKDDTFSEVYGILPGDDRRPQLLLWKRVKE